MAIIEKHKQVQYHGGYEIDVKFNYILYAVEDTFLNTIS